MHKVVFNNCYGGFSISMKAVDWLEANCKDKKLRDFIKSSRLDDEESYCALKDERLCYDVSDWFEDKRHHKDLVAVVEALGADANGPCAALGIRKIDGNQYRIDEYDGAEEVIVPDCENWIYIND